MKKLTLVFAALVLLTSLVSAQSKKTELKPEQLGNLVTAINSDNEGLQRSGLYIIAQNGITEASEAVQDLYDTTKSESVKFHAMRAMLILGGSDNLDKIKEISKNETNIKLRTLAYSYYNHVVDDVLRYASN